MPASDAPPREGWRWPLGLLVAAGAALAFVLAFPPVDLWPLVVLTPALLAAVAVRAASGRSAFLIVFATQLLMWLWLQRWMTGVTAAGYPCLAAYLALYGAAFVLVVRRIRRHAVLGRWPLAVVVPITWTALECLRGEVLFDGYAWFLLAHPLIGWPPLVQSADLLGTYLPGTLAAAAAGVGVDLALRRRGPRPGRPVLVAAGVVLAALALNLAYGLVETARGRGEPDGPTFLLIQTNLPQSNKVAWTLEAQRRDVASFVALTREAFFAAKAEHGAIDAVVWPETMLPVRGLEPATLAKVAEWSAGDEVAFADALFDLSEELKTPFIVGSACYTGLEVDLERRRWTWEASYNSAYLVEGRAATARYDKVHLTPFGEVMPYISRWPWLEARLLALGAEGMSFTLHASDRIERLPLPTAAGTIEVATPICFEDAVPGLVRRMTQEPGRRRAVVLVNLSNDGWFGDHDDGRAQHAQIARFRCIENRVPMVRSVNTGYTISIDPFGRVVAAVGEGRYGAAREAGWLAAKVAAPGAPTLYGRVGEIWSFVCLALGTGLLVTTLFFRRKG